MKTVFSLDLFSVNTKLEMINSLEELGFSAEPIEQIGWNLTLERPKEIHLSVGDTIFLFSMFFEVLKKEYCIEDDDEYYWYDLKIR